VVEPATYRPHGDALTMDTSCTKHQLTSTKPPQEIKAQSIISKKNVEEMAAFMKKRKTIRDQTKIYF